MLIEAMKKLRVIEKRIESNQADITKYAAGLENEKEVFGSLEQQKKEVEALVQSNNDLMKESINLKLQIEYTNLNTVASICGEKRRISEWLVIKRKYAKLMIGTYEALNSTKAKLRLTVRSGSTNDQKIVRYYDEKYKNENILKWKNIYSEIDSSLEVINATTELKELPQLQ